MNSEGSVTVLYTGCEESAQGHCAPGLAQQALSAARKPVFHWEKRAETSYPLLCFFFLGVSSSDVLLPRPRELLFSF